MLTWIKSDSYISWMIKLCCKKYKCIWLARPWETEFCCRWATYDLCAYTVVHAPLFTKLLQKIIVYTDKTLLNISALAANIQVRTMEDNALYNKSKGLFNISRFVFHVFRENYFVSIFRSHKTGVAELSILALIRPNSCFV